MNTRMAKVLGSLVLVGALAFSIQANAAWMVPPANPPANNAAEPINVGSANQTKAGKLDVTSDLATYGTLWGFNGTRLFGSLTVQGPLWTASSILHMYPNGTSGMVIDTWPTGTDNAAITTTPAYLWLNPFGGSAGDEFENPSNGRVAIGYSNAPQFALDVAGTVRATGSVRADNNLVSRALNLYDFSQYGGPSVNQDILLVQKATVSGINGWSFTSFKGGGGYGGMSFTAKDITLDVRSGNLKLPQGAGAGKVLTSDASGNATWQTGGTSDTRLKKDISPINGALELVKNLKGVRFSWKDSGEKSIGVIAQDVEQVVPEVVHTNSAGYKTVEYDKLVGVLIEAIKEQNIKIETLSKEIQSLKK